MRSYHPRLAMRRRLHRNRYFKLKQIDKKLDMIVKEIENLKYESYTNYMEKERIRKISEDINSQLYLK